MNNQQQNGFYGLGVAPGLLQILEKLKFTSPTPIQRQAIPVGVEGKDVVGIAQTGTGKTLAFGIPMVQRLAQTKGRGLVLLPTRELALQVDEVLHTVGKSLGLRTAVLIGGASIRPQIQALRGNPHVIVATPGRLNDHLEQKTLSLANVHMLVLDEADRMLDMGFLPQIQRILKMLPQEKQTMLFSATLSPEIMKIASSTMKLPVRIEIAPQGTTAERVMQEMFIIKKDAKNRLLEKILGEQKVSTLVFTRTKHGASRVMRSVRTMGYTAAEIHSNRSLGQRKEALAGFKSGKYQVLVATDIAARGIDVTGIELVINYDLPSTAADYVHRIGRTGRAGASGRAISFALPEEQRDIRDIERLIRKNLERLPVPELPPDRPRADNKPNFDERRPFSPRGAGAPRRRTPRSPSPFGNSSRPSSQNRFRRRDSGGNRGFGGR
ncbi:MAG: DEAD/DEAH box helicase [Patescibacteria group bacterium]